MDESEESEEIGEMYLMRGPGPGMESNWCVGVGGGTQRPLESLVLAEHRTGCQGNSCFQYSVGTLGWHIRQERKNSARLFK